MKIIDKPSEVLALNPRLIKTNKAPTDDQRTKDRLYRAGQGRGVLLARVQKTDSLNGRRTDTVVLVEEDVSHGIDEIDSLRFTVKPGDCNITWFKGRRANIG